VDGGSESEGASPLLAIRCCSRERVTVSLLAAAFSITVEISRSACESRGGRHKTKTAGKVKVRLCNRTLDNPVLEDWLVARL